MRDFFILWLERLVSVFIVLMAVVVFLTGLVMIFANPEGILMGLLIGLLCWLIGAVYVILVGGGLYLGLGIYANTKRTAEAVERLSQRP